MAVGYEYVTCSGILWETLTATLHGFHMDISDVGGWNLDIHHMYNFEAGEFAFLVCLCSFCFFRIGMFYIFIMVIIKKQQQQLK